MKQLIAALCLFVGMTAGVKAQSILEAAEGQNELSTFLTACKAADLTETLNGEEVTIFAPSNDAFAALPAGTLETLLMPENKDQLVQLLSYHIIPGKMPTGELIEGKSITQAGEDVDVSVSDEGVMYNNATVTTADVIASNGVIHIIDSVVMPPSQLKN